MIDSALSDEAEYDGHQPINQGPGQGGVTQHPEDRIAPSDRDMDAESEADFPARVNITVEKAGSGAILFQTYVQNGFFQIEDISYFNKPDLAHAQTAEKDWVRQSVYAGPPFGNLDEGLQNFLDRYLEERGINAELATMIPDYIQVKEQKEYVSWLESKLLPDPISCVVGKYLTDDFRHEELHVRLNAVHLTFDNPPSSHRFAFNSIFSRVVCSIFPAEICQ